MSLEKFGHRSEDKGKEPYEVVLARIDENIKFLRQGAIDVKVSLMEHQKEDDTRFDGIYKKLWEHARYIYIGLGIVGVIEVIMNIHK